MNVYPQILEAALKGQKMLAVLIDPDRIDPKRTALLAAQAAHYGISFFMVGGSLLTEGEVSQTVKLIKSHAKLPVVLFPGHYFHLAPEADSLFLLSLISGRNPEYLIGQHVAAAPRLRRMDLEVIPTGYMLVLCDNLTTVSYVSQTLPIPYEKAEVAANTALAGEYLGMRLAYLDGGSGAAKPISPRMIRTVKQSINIPLIVGGGIRTPEALHMAYAAGADVVVVGTRLEEEPALIADFAAVLHQFNKKKV